MTVSSTTPGSVALHLGLQSGHSYGVR